MLTDDQLATIVTLLNSGRKIDAIRQYREFTGLLLRESKDAVEAIEKGLPPLPERCRHKSAYEVGVSGHDADEWIVTFRCEACDSVGDFIIHATQIEWRNAR